MKKLCKLSKDEQKTLKAEIFELVKEPKYICRKCLRVSSCNKSLCKDTSFSKFFQEKQ